MRVAITGVGGGVGQAVIRSLRLSRFPLHLIGLDANAWSAGLYQCDRGCTIPLASQEKAYLAALEDIVTSCEVEALIPGTDNELCPLAAARPRLEALGCCTIVSSPATVRMARDKMAAYQILSRAGIPFAQTVPVQEFARTCTADSFPAMLKPKDGSGSVGARVLFSPEDLGSGRPDEGDIVQEYLIPASWGISQLRPRDVMRDGRMRQDEELSLQGLVAPDGEVVGVFVSINELRDGVVMKVRPTAEPDLMAFAWDIFAILARLGLVGPCNVEGRITRSGPVFYEINPRFTGVSAARAEMGFNECEAALRLFVREEAPSSVAPDLACRADLVCVRYVDEQLVPRDLIDRVGKGFPATSEDALLWGTESG